MAPWNPQLGLAVASALASFLLRTAVEWLAVIALVRTAASARARARIWLGMLVVFAVQWAWTLAGVARAVFSASRLAGGPVRSAQMGDVSRAGIAVSSGVASVVAPATAVVLAVYGTGIVWQLFGAALARIRLVHVLRFRRGPGERVLAAFERAYGERGLSCELWMLPGLASPATLGWLRPRVLLPVACEMQDEAELEAVLWHELKHVERRDALWNGIARLCRSLVWFHPGVHHALGGLVAERELACDAEVIGEHPESRDVYATCLVRFARAVDLATTPAIAAVEMASRATQLSIRVRSILTESPQTGMASGFVRSFTSAMIAVAVLCTAPNLAVVLRAQLATGAVARADLPAAALPVARPMRRIAPARGRGGISEAPMALASVAIPISHDEALAAEHRVAMGVLTESTGMEQSADNENGAAAAEVGAPGHGSYASGTWASVAVDAAEHMGPLLAGHDGDDRH